ncbi:MAG TPA: dCTP deaminase, partial [Oceanospirillales bacterium]|nr:dCTP deaminase [Oceanospirillales bacterium]
MRLSDGDIEQRIEQGSIAIEPAPAPESIAGISVDLRLANSFRVFSNNTV